MLHFKKNGKKEQESVQKPILSPFMEIERDIACASIFGTREYQQDAARVTKKSIPGGELCLCVLADGMGGLENGDIASKYCTSEIINDFCTNSLDTDITDFMINEIHKVNNAVTNMVNADGSPMNCGCTLVQVCINTQTKELFWASVGDSRIYLIRQHKAVALTNDHTYYYDLLKMAENGTISMQEAENNPKKDALTSFIGLPQISLICHNTQAFMLEKNDVIVVCSDGLYRTLSETDIAAIVDNRTCDAYLTAHNLIVSSLDSAIKAHDNTTAIVYFCK